MTDASKPNLETPKGEQISEYRNGTAPKAANRYGGRGATSLQDIQDALDARRRHNESLSNRDIGPRSSGNRDSK
jgi:hypothetical protein